MKTALWPERIKGLRNKYLPLVSFATALLLSLGVHAQYDSTKNLQRNNSYGYWWRNLKVDPSGALIIPSDTVKLTTKDTPAIAIKNNQLFFWTGYFWQIASSDIAGVLSGTGSPEGVVTASVGTLYRRLDGTTNATLYVKESGSGNTGWVAIGAGGTNPPTAVYIDDETIIGGNTADNPIKANTDILALKSELPKDSIGRVGDSIRLYRNGVHLSSVIDNVGEPGEGDGFGDDTVATKGFIKGKGLVGAEVELDSALLLSIIRSQFPVGTNPDLIGQLGITTAKNTEGNWVITCTGCAAGSNPFSAIVPAGLVADVVVPGSGSTVTGTDNSPFLQAAINSSADNQIIVVPPGGANGYGFFTPLDTIRGPKTVRVLILGNTYHNGSDFIILGNASGPTENHTIEHYGDCIGRVNSPSYTTTTYANGTGPNFATYTGVPFKIYNSNQHQVKFNRVQGFKAPFEAIGWDYDGAGRGIEEAYVSGREVRDCANGIILTSINGRSFVDKVYYTGWDGGIITVRAALGIKIDGYSGTAFNGEVYNGAFRSNEFHMLIERCDSIAEVHGDVTENLFDVTVEGSAVHGSVGWRMRSVTPNYVRDPVYTGRGVFGEDWMLHGLGLNAKGYVPIWHSASGRRYSNTWETDGSGNLIIIGSTLSQSQRNAGPVSYRYAPGPTAVIYKTVTTTPYTAAAGEVIQYSNASGTIAAPSATSNVGRTFTVQNTHGSIAVTITGVVVVTSVPAGQTMTWQSNGVDWRPIVNLDVLGGVGGGIFVTDPNGGNSNGLRIGIQTNSSPSTAFNIAASTSSQASLRINPGAHPLTPVNGDEWRFQGRRFTAYNSIVSEYLLVPDDAQAGDQIFKDATNTSYVHRQPNYEMKAAGTGVLGTFTSTGTTTVLNGGPMEVVPNGSRYICTLTGHISVAADDTPNWQFQMGSETIIVEFPTFPSGITTRDFKITFELTKRSTGYYWETELRIDNGTLMIHELKNGSSATTLPTTGNMLMHFDWDASGNTLVVYSGVWEIKRWQ